MIRYKLPLMPKALFGGTLLSHGLMIFSGATAPPQVAPNVRLPRSPHEYDHLIMSQGCKSPHGETPKLATPISRLSMVTIMTIESRQKRPSLHIVYVVSFSSPMVLLY
jgi:hypothetical protein